MIYVAQIALTILGCMCLLWDLQFIDLMMISHLLHNTIYNYVIIGVKTIIKIYKMDYCSWLKKHWWFHNSSINTYIWQVVKMHIIITHVYICPNPGCTAWKMAIFITCQDCQTQVGDHHNNRLKCMISNDHSYRQSITLLLLVIIFQKIKL